MRFIIIILIFINLGVWTFFNQDLFYKVNASTGNAEMVPDKMHLLTPHQLSKLPTITTTVDAIDEPPQLDINVVTSEPEPVHCYTWGILNKVNISTAKNIISELSLEATMEEHSSKEAIRYWVYLPPLKSASAAQTEAARLKAKGIKDLFVLQGKKWRNAISFGVFEDEALASKLLKSLKGKGIKNVTKTMRGKGSGGYSLHISNVKSETLKTLKAKKAAYPATKINESNCR